MQGARVAARTRSQQREPVSTLMTRAASFASVFDVVREADRAKRRGSPLVIATSRSFYASFPLPPANRAAIGAKTATRHPGDSDRKTAVRFFNLHKYATDGEFSQPPARRKMDECAGAVSSADVVLRTHTFAAAAPSVIHSTRSLINGVSDGSNSSV